MPRSEEPVTSVEGDGRTSDRIDTHPAFGVASVARSSGSSRTLFQSDLRHNETIRLTILTAERGRSLNRDWVHPRKTLIEVEMSLAQWGAVVSSIGIGSGVPVTIRSTESDHTVPGLPYEPRIAENIAETENVVGKLLERARVTLAALEAAIDGKLGVKATREALRAHKIAVSGAENTATFAVTSLKEAAETVTAQARADIEAQILNAQLLTGVQASIEAPDITPAALSR